MNLKYLFCPKCGSSSGLGSPYIGARGELWSTCHRLGPPEHLGCKVHFNIATGEVIQPRDGIHARVMNLLSAGTPMPFRGFAADFLQSEFGVTGITASQLGIHCQSSMPAIWKWATVLEQQGLKTCMVPITRDHRLVGLQLRPLPVGPTRRVEVVKDFRTVGETEGLFIPRYTGRNPMAVIIKEGIWDTITYESDAREYGNTDFFSVSVLNAGVKASTIKSTLDLIFPGVPRFSLYDQDPAGVAARLATLGVAKPILVSGAGPGKDYRSLTLGLRFERLVQVVVRELKQMGAW